MIIDTNIIIDLLKGKDEAQSFLESSIDTNLFLSVITTSEINTGIRDEREEQIFEELLSIFEVIPVTQTIAIESGKLRKKFLASHGIETPDAIIAATANLLEVPIATLDKKHFSVLTDELIVPY
ncbi:type II toxin-antitoxin system VapC family toxin [Gracilimonas mengyeensis]|uniref:Ribonuclease VapC n=1 Tax=Gracilimonas mengyeensis TaxID=1302730 RepID=A0A521CX31_9BACT|nr:type II toxin-antitoxin system VapC family toxin [Gracilimonas mengyeensis]SMO63999.1 hypothetical protein SAMN06265219_106198 [Gracilimonas mengyeensis]